MSTAIEFSHVSKQYRLGLVSTKTLSHDIRRFWITNVLGKEDPYLKIGETNDRASKGTSEYVWALRDIDFKVEQGDVVGIIGKNGAGKSTLLKLLSRVTGPTTGTIRAHGRIGSLLEVGTGFHGEMTGRENIFMNGAILGMSRAEIQSKLDEIIDFSGCERYIDTPVKRYSSGMTVRLGFAVAAFLEPEILVVDEVLAVGDAEFQKKAIGKMKDVSQGQGRTVLFVSHNMASVRQLCKNGILLEKGMVKFMGPIDQTIAKYLMDDKTFDSVFYPENNIVQRVSAAQNDAGIEIRLKYKSDFAIKQPNFGFVIFDQYQNPICGTDTLKSALLEFGEPKREGEVVVQIDSPTLYKGHYYVGIWFGDGKNNQVFANERCLEIDIQDTNFKTVMKDVADEGCIVPSCEWSFN
jgi:lipopolysaccharide transport system ATP-binding protein